MVPALAAGMCVGLVWGFLGWIWGGFGTSLVCFNCWCEGRFRSGVGEGVCQGLDGLRMGSGLLSIDFGVGLGCRMGIRLVLWVFGVDMKCALLESGWVCLLLHVPESNRKSQRKGLGAHTHTKTTTAICKTARFAHHPGSFVFSEPLNTREGPSWTPCGLSSARHVDPRISYG